jgi:superfamily II DNA or RNA helicase
MALSNHQKGLQYELYIRDFIRTQLNKKAYLWNECPENILLSNNLISSHNNMRIIRKELKEGHLHHHKDIGIDVIQLEKDDASCSIVQCKNGYKNGLTVENIAGIMMRVAAIRDINAFIYHTNYISNNVRQTIERSKYIKFLDCTTDAANKLKEITENGKAYFVKMPMDEDTDISSNKQSIQCNITPYDYQLEALNKFRQHFKNNNRGILSLPCGCGKTFTSYLISNDYDNIIVITTLREFASQNLNRFTEYGYDNTKTMLVDTDGVRDINIVKQFISQNDKLLISCTYDSMDLISQCLDLFRNSLFIIDEFHNLSKSNISDDENPIFKLLMSDHKIMFMSATPRIYELEYDNDSYDMEWLFGDVVYNINMADAIQKGYICDYKIWLPSIHENNDELNKELSIYDIDDKLKNRCKYLYSCIANNGSRKCIIYCQDRQDMKMMMECMETLNEFYIMDIEISSISCDDNFRKRKEKLYAFSNNNEKIQFLFNMRILNECIDIPACDSVYISYVPQNKITTVQRICRANRIDRMNPYKIANVYIWCDEYADILDTLSSIKEYDIMFQRKISVNEINFYNNRTTKDKELFEQDKKLVSDYVIGITEFKDTNWYDRLNQLIEYIEKHNKLPSRCNKNNEIHTLGAWVHNQKTNFRLKIKTMRKPERLNKWKELMHKYPTLFMSYEELWYYHKQEVEDYIQEHNKMPQITKKDKTIRALGKWVNTQKYNYEIKRDIMSSNLEIRKEWEDFVEKYADLMLSNIDMWKFRLASLETFIQTNDRLPLLSKRVPDEYKLALWFHSQDKSYNNPGPRCVMNDTKIRELWKKFTNTHLVSFT